MPGSGPQREEKGTIPTHPPPHSVALLPLFFSRRRVSELRGAPSGEILLFHVLSPPAAGSSPSWA